MISTSLVVIFQHLFAIISKKNHNFPFLQGFEKNTPPGCYWRIYGITEPTVLQIELLQQQQLHYYNTNRQMALQINYAYDGNAEVIDQSNAQALEKFPLFHHFTARRRYLLMASW